MPAIMLVISLSSRHVRVGDRHAHIYMPSSLASKDACIGLIDF